MGEWYLDPLARVIVLFFAGYGLGGATLSVAWLIRDWWRHGYGPD